MRGEQVTFDLGTYHRLRTSESIGASIFYRDETASTMDDARAGAANGNICGTAYVASAQTSGRGRMGRAWASDVGGLYVTYHLCPLDASIAPLHSIAGALAVADSLQETSGFAVDVKWPNDVLHEGRKLAGILAESTLGERTDVFLGIGINVRAATLPPEVASIATSIEQAGGRIPAPEELLASLSAALERHVAQLERSPADVVKAWRSRLTTLGRRIRLAGVDGRQFEGEAVDVSPAGELIVQLDDRTVTSFAAGDVTTLPG
jgi:BirA family transcriptional regulator, biotin operon repressor / biotin---[acetyl-CoA-carboxylase] ligase